MSNGNDEFVKMEISKFVTPKGKLGEVLELIDGLPMLIPKTVVGMVARLAFTAAYTQVTTDLTEINKEMIDSLTETMEELGTWSLAHEEKVKEVIRKIIDTNMLEN